MALQLKSLVLLCMCAFVTALDQPKVTLSDGSVIFGLQEEYSNDYLNLNANIDVYRGIPYAKPPVGSLRFRPPEKKEALSEPLNATKVGNACLQMIMPENPVMEMEAEEKSEDCLYLDVLVPNPLPEDCPVLVQIHGGGFAMGSGSMKLFSLRPLVAYGNYIVVTINYRLTVFGFMTTDDDVIPGNLGLRDQQLSLQWVHDNIAAFGGNPNRVTITGVSAGSASVGFHLLAPGSKGLFQNAIMESGSPIDAWCKPFPAEKRLEIVKTVAQVCGCTEEETAESESLVACLQKIPADDFIQNEAKVMEQLGSIYLYPPSLKDGTFLPKSVTEYLKAGEVNPANVIIGTNKDEGSLFFTMMFPDKDVMPVVNASSAMQVLGMFQSVSDTTVLDVVRAVFTENEEDFSQEEQLFQPVTDFLSSYIMLCAQNQYTLDYAATGNDIYRFFYTHTASQTVFNFTWTGASHGDEMIFTFGLVFEPGLQDRQLTDEEMAMAVQVQKYWTNFIHTGNPNSDLTDQGPYPSWPKFSGDTKEYKELSLKFANNRNLREKECFFVDNVLPKLNELADKAKETEAPSEDEKSKWTEEGQCEGEDCHND